LLLGYLELARQSPLPPDSRLALDTAHDAGRQLAQRIGDLIDFNRLGRERLRVRPQTVSLPALWRRVQSQADWMARERGRTLTVQWDPDLPDWVELDGQRVQQVLVILLDNAMRHAGPGAITLRARLRQAPALALEMPMLGVCFEVDNPKPGLKPEALAQLLQPSADPAPATPNQIRSPGAGLGLGLSIAHQLLALMHSHLEGRSAPDQGSCFHFTLWTPPMPSPRTADDDAVTLWTDLDSAPTQEPAPAPASTSAPSAPPAPPTAPTGPAEVDSTPQTAPPDWPRLLQAAQAGDLGALDHWQAQHADLLVQEPALARQLALLDLDALEARARHGQAELTAPPQAPAATSPADAGPAPAPAV
jgi:hypothetical protein